jgi:uncharacterized phage-associated protein
MGIQSNKVNILDVAQYIIEKMGVLPSMKLQKLCYYCQAWSLVWDEQKLFEEKIEAWINGPVIPVLYKKYDVSSINLGQSSKLADFQKESIDKVLDFYGKYTSQELSDLTHLENPWKIARKGLADNIRSNREITVDSMMEYYSGL